MIEAIAILAIGVVILLLLLQPIRLFLNRYRCANPSIGVPIYNQHPNHISPILILMGC